MRSNEPWTVYKTTTCPECGGTLECRERVVSWTMYVPSSWGEDEEYETATRREYCAECLNPACDYGDYEPATY